MSAVPKLYVVALRCHFMHYRGNRVDTIKTSWHVAQSPEEAEESARRKARAERCEVDSVMKVAESPTERGTTVKSAECAATKENRT